MHCLVLDIVLRLWHFIKILTKLFKLFYFACFSFTPVALKMHKIFNGNISDVGAECLNVPVGKAKFCLVALASGHLQKVNDASLTVALLGRTEQI